MEIPQRTQQVEKSEFDVVTQYMVWVLAFMMFYLVAARCSDQVSERKERIRNKRVDLKAMSSDVPVPTEAGLTVKREKSCKIEDAIDTHPQDDDIKI